MEDYDTISNYFKGALSAEEMILFDKKIQNDPAFAEEVAFYCSSQSVIKDQLALEKKKRFREIYDADKNFINPNAPVTRMWTRAKIAVAAAAVIIIAAGLLWWSRPSAIDMADKFIQTNFYNLPVTMGKADSLQQGIKHNNDNRLKEAAKIFEQLSSTDTTNDLAITYAGVVSLRLKDYDKAFNYFSRLENMQQLSSNPGKFYKALTLVKRNLSGDKVTAKQMLQEIVAKDPEWASQANEFLKKM